MTAVDVIGWSGSVTGIVLGLPQLVHLVRTRDVEGLSLRTWQAFLAVNLGWTAHGITIGQPPQFVTSALSLCATVPILVLLARQAQRSLLLTLMPGVVLAAVMILIDQLFGSAAYGAVAIVPAVIANASQSVALVRAAHVSGVSPTFLVLAVVNQVIWFTWAVRIDDHATIIAASTTGAIATFNLGWYTARRLGVGPLSHARTDATLRPPRAP